MKLFDYLRPNGGHSTEAKLAFQKFDHDELHVLKKTRLVIFFQAIYLMLTIIVGAMRLQKFGQSNSEVAHYVATDNSFITASVIQKTVAVLYYAVNIFYTVKLEDPIYYNRDAWISLIRQ
eukprot:gene6031-7695_t